MKIKMCLFIGCLLLICLGSCSVIKGEGSIVFPVYQNDTTRALMIIDMESTNHEPRVLYEYENEYLMYPSIYNNSFVCVSRETNSSTGRLISFEGDKRNILFEFSFDTMMYPQIIVDNNIIYLGYHNNGFYLGKVDISKQSSNILKDDIDYFVPSIQDGKNILISKIENDESYIYLCDIEGNTTKLTKGTTPVWYNNCKKFLFVSEDGINIYDLEKDTVKQLLKGEYYLSFEAALSPDNKYIAYYHGSEYSWPYTANLRIMSLEDGRSIDIDCKGVYKEAGLAWIK